MPGNPDEANKLRKQVSTLAEFGKGALRVDDVGKVLQEATRLVSNAIDVDLGTGARRRQLGSRCCGTRDDSRKQSAAGYALQTGKPVICENVATETRFEIPMLLTQHGVKSTVNVLDRGDDKPFGILEVDARELRSFAQYDIDFLQKYANLLSAAIKRVNTQAELAARAQHERVLGNELQHRINNKLMTIRAIARRTRAQSQSLDEFAKSFDDRLAAIARTHALLSQTETSTVAMRELLAQEMSAHGAIERENLTQRGPDLLISAKQAQALSMAQPQ